jgi:hypothetical protein
MGSSGMLSLVPLVRTDVSEELSASLIRVIRIGELGTTLEVTSNRRMLRRNTRRLLVTASFVPTSPILVTLMKEALSSTETSVNILEDAVLQHNICPLSRTIALFVDNPKLCSSVQDTQASVAMFLLYL